MIRKLFDCIVSTLSPWLASAAIKILLYGGRTAKVKPLYGKFYTMIRQYSHDEYVMSVRSKYDIHPSVRFGFDTKIYGQGHISIGEDTYFGRHCFILSNTPMTKLIIGKRCSISHNVHIRTEKHKRLFDFSDERVRPQMGDNIEIGDSVWIGANVFIKSGITIGDNSIIGANSVVTANIPPNTIYGGVPARLIREKSVYLDSMPREGNATGGFEVNLEGDK